MKPTKDATKTRKDCRLRQLRREFALAVMQRDYATADRRWIQLDRLELKKRTILLGNRFVEKSL